MTNIAAPKIPDGEKVDFDVSRLQQVEKVENVSENQLSPGGFGWFCSCGSLPTAGHPQEASGEGPVRAAVADRGSLHPEEEGGRGAHRPRQQNRTFGLNPSVTLCDL